MLKSSKCNFCEDYCREGFSSSTKFLAGISSTIASIHKTLSHTHTEKDSRNAKNMPYHILFKQQPYTRIVAQIYQVRLFPRSTVLTDSNELQHTRDVSWHRTYLVCFLEVMARNDLAIVCVCPQPFQNTAKIFQDTYHSFDGILDPDPLSI